MNDSQSQTRPRPWRLQFSLRLLLIAFTAFAVGFPIWYRWPYEETEWNRTKTTRIVSTWRRDWGGGRKKHGVQRQIQNGEVIESLVYRDGLRHGAYVSEHDRGEFVNDKREGIWAGPNYTATWHHSKLHGPFELRLPKPGMRASAKNLKLPTELRTIQMVFENGRLRSFNGQPASGRLFDLLDDDTVDERLRFALSKHTDLDVVEMPIKDIMVYLSQLYNLPFVLDEKVQADLPLTGTFQGMDLCSVLLMITAPYNLACDYRYGCLWITTREDGDGWRDPTGVSDLKPPLGSALARAWHEISPPVSTIAMPLTEVLAYLKQPLAIDIDTSQIEEATADSSPPLVTANIRELRFCDTLGQLLYKTRCRCRLEGEILVILPQQPTR